MVALGALDISDLVDIVAYSQTLPRRIVAPGQPDAVDLSG
jgi:hypothetical protein